MPCSVIITVLFNNKCEALLTEEIHKVQCSKNGGNMGNFRNACLLEEPLILAFIKANVQQLKYEFVKLVIDWVSENKFLDS